MFEIIISNFVFWINLLIPIGIALYFRFTNKKYIWKEFGIQSVATVGYLFLIFYILFATTTDLIDKEYINGKVQQFIKEEAYDYEYDCSYEKCDKDGNNCRTVHKICEDREPEKNFIVTSTNHKVYIKHSDFREAYNLFGGSQKKVYHSNQTTSSKLRGEGDIWTSTPNKVLPISIESSYTNYVVAANHNVVNQKVPQSEIDFYLKDKKLIKYPEIYTENFGVTKIRRVLDLTNNPYTNEYNNRLNLMAANIGKLKQVNPMIYITNESRNFYPVLNAYYKGGKKNDAILVLGINDNGEIIWSNVIAWSKNSDFYIDMANNFVDKKLKINDIEQVLYTFRNTIIDSYERKPMEEFSYLKENITLGFIWQILIFIGNLLLSFFLIKYFLKD